MDLKSIVSQIDIITGFHRSDTERRDSGGRSSLGDDIMEGIFKHIRILKP